MSYSFTEDDIIESHPTMRLLRMMESEIKKFIEEANVKLRANLEAMITKSDRGKKRDREEEVVEKSNNTSFRDFLIDFAISVPSSSHDFWNKWTSALFPAIRDVFWSCDPKILDTVTGHVIYFPALRFQGPYTHISEVCGYCNTAVAVDQRVMASYPSTGGLSFASFCADKCVQKIKIIISVLEMTWETYLAHRNGTITNYARECQRFQEFIQTLMSK